MVALQELARVTRPGGRIAITVPFRRRGAIGQTTQDVYERESDGTPIHWARYYDVRGVRRLVQPVLDQCDVEEALLWDHTSKGARLFVKMPRVFKTLRFMTNPLHARFGFRLASDGIGDSEPADPEPEREPEVLIGSSAAEVEKLAQPFGLAGVLLRKRD